MSGVVGLREKNKFFFQLGCRSLQRGIEKMMEVITIEDPAPEDLKSIEAGVMAFGIAQVQGVLPTKKAFHLKQDGELIGGATGRVHFSKFYLDNLWVQDEYRSLGHGTRIHAAVVNCANENGCSTIYLQTLNRQAVELYRRLNYATVAVIDDYVDGFDLYHMALKLS
jgi:ribosomal protein S18 acetylase RimI-like enzyme